jgi:hypothetical protein
MPDVDAAVYVYGVSPKRSYDSASLSGVDVEIETVEHDGLVALTSPLHNGTLTARDVRAHWRVLERVFDHATVLPMRFGTVMESREAVRDRLLAPNSDRLSDLLAQMDGLVQLNVKGRYDEELLLREIVKRSPAIARLRDRVRAPGTGTPAQQIQLGGLVNAEIERYRDADTHAALRGLEQLAVSARAEQVNHPNAFDLAFLVERPREADFGGGVARLREDLGERVEIRYLGPLPPFSFAQADLTTGG